MIAALAFAHGVTYARAMTRVYARSNPDRIGTIVGDAPHGDVLVHWDGEDADRHWRLARNQLVELHQTELQLLDMLDRLRDAFNLQIESTMRDIRRIMKKEERR